MFWKKEMLGSCLSILFSSTSNKYHVHLMRWRTRSAHIQNADDDNWVTIISENCHGAKSRSSAKLLVILPTSKIVFPSRRSNYPSRPSDEPRNVLPKRPLPITRIIVFKIYNSLAKDIGILICPDVALLFYIPPGDNLSTKSLSNIEERRLFCKLPSTNQKNHIIPEVLRARKVSSTLHQRVYTKTNGKNPFSSLRMQ